MPVGGLAGRTSTLLPLAARHYHAAVGGYRETLRRVQRELAEAAYFKGDINGLFGEDSVKALEAFQTDRNLEVTGIPDLATLVTVFRDITESEANQ